MSEPHYFEFQPHLGPGPRPCRACDKPYDVGAHIEITTLKPMTNYVCPAGTGLGHSGHYTGALRPEFRSLTQHLCICGAELVEEDQERWLVRFQIPAQGGWRTVESHGSKHSATTQYEGLLKLVEAGEAIRSVELMQLVELASVSSSPDSRSDS